MTVPRMIETERDLLELEALRYARLTPPAPPRRPSSPRSGAARALGIGDPHFPVLPDRPVVVPSPTRYS